MQDYLENISAGRYIFHRQVEESERLIKGMSMRAATTKTEKVE